MLDINFIEEHGKELRRAIQGKGIELDLDALLAVSKERRSLRTELESLKHSRNLTAQAIQKSGRAKPDAALIEQGRGLKEKIAELEPRVKEAEARFSELMLLVPNIPSDDTPVGADESANREVRRWGTPRRFDFPFKDHLALGTSLDILDADRGVKVSGFRGYYLKGDLALLQWALMTYCIGVMQRSGFTLMIPPTLVREPALIGSGHFPAGRDEAYRTDDMFLAGTSEPALLAYRAGEMLDAAELPLRYCGFSPCYRREVGSYGKDTKGVYRVHEFWKVEQVVICENDLNKSLPLFEGMLSLSEEIVQALGLSYRVVQIATGDMGAGKYKMYDIETWMPSRDAYGETHSCSHLTDWQARRLDLRYKTEAGTALFPHTMNNTVIASPRILIALMEHYQEADGTITVPEVLRPFMNGKTKLGS